MEVTNKKLVSEFLKKHNQAKASVQKWLLLVEQHDFKHHNDLKTIFPSADYVGNGRYVFNIKGNDFRFVVAVAFFMNRMEIRFCGTHAEYDKIKDIKNI